MAFYNQLRVYEDGGLIVFADASGTVFTSEPKGSVRVKSPSGGMCFENIQTGDEIASVAAPGDVRDATGTAYGANFAAVLTALGAFFFIDSGGGTAADVAYDNANSGLSASNVQAAIDELAADEIFTRRPGLHNFNRGGTPSGIVQVNDGVFVAFGFEVLGKQTVSELMIEVTNAAAAGTKFVVGIYKNNNGLPGEKITQTGAFAGDLVAVQTLPFAKPVELRPGLYFYCIMSNAANMYCRALQAANMIPAFGYSSTTSAPLTRGLSGAYAYNATMPSSAPTVNTFANADAPFILLKTI